MAGIDIISDRTGKEIVAAIQSTDVAQARILEINAAAESKKNEVLESIPEDYRNIVDDVSELKSDLTSLEDIKQCEVTKVAYQNARLNNDGNIITSNGNNVTDFIPIAYAKKVVLSYAHREYTNYIIYDDQKVAVYIGNAVNDGFSGNQADYVCKNIDKGSYIRCVFWENDDVKKVTVYEKNFPKKVDEMAQKVDEIENQTDTLYSKNAIREASKSNTRILDDGSLVASSSGGITDYIPLKKVKSVVLSLANSLYVNYVIYDNNKDIVYIGKPSTEGIKSNTENYECLNIDKGAYIRCMLWKSDDVRTITITKNTLDIINDTLENISVGGSQWGGKKWYAYGTSMTDTTTNPQKFGKYAEYLQKLSGMTMFNYGIGGSGIIPSLHDSDNVKTRVMRLTDGKSDADLITLEIMPNDMSGTLGDITSVGDDTFLGNLAQCLNYLQTNTNAQIVVLIPTRPRYNTYNQQTVYNPESAESTTWRTWANAVKEKCAIYNVPVFDGSAESGLGFYRVGANGGDYVLDQIHLSALGGYNLALFYWEKLKALPNWHTDLLVN